MKTLLDRVRAAKADELAPGEEFLAAVVLVSRGATAQQRAAVAGGVLGGAAGGAIAGKIAKSTQHTEKIPPGFSSPAMGIVVMALTPHRILVWKRGTVMETPTERVGAFPLSEILTVRYGKGKGVSDFTVLLKQKVALQCEAVKNQSANLQHFVDELGRLGKQGAAAAEAAQAAAAQPVAAPPPPPPPPPAPAPSPNAPSALPADFWSNPAPAPPPPSVGDAEEPPKERWTAVDWP